MAASTTSLPETPGGARNWDYRYTWIRDTGFMLRSLYRLGFDWEALEYFAFVLESVTQGNARPAVRAPDHVRHRRRARPHREDPRPPVGIRRRPSGPGRQRRLGPAPERRVGHAARRRRPAPEAGSGPDRPPGVGGPGRHWWTRRWPTAATPIRASGRSAASPSTSPPRPSCAGWRPTGGPIWPFAEATPSGPNAGARVPMHLKADILSKGVDERGTVPAGLRERRARRLAPPHPHHGLPPARRRAGQGHRTGHRRRAHRGRVGAPLQGGQHRHRVRGQGGHLHHLLVVAGLGPGHDRRDRSGPGACARSCSPLPALSTSTPRRSTSPPGSTSGTSPRPSPIWP